MDEFELEFDTSFDQQFEIDMENIVQKVQPALIDLEVIPNKERQVFIHEGEYGYDQVVVEPIPPIKLQEKSTIPTKEMQEIVSNEGYDGLGKVTINPIPNEYIIPNGTLEIIENGKYDIKEKEFVNINLSDDILNGIVKEYKTYAGNGNLTISSKTFVEFITVNYNSYFTNGTIIWIGEYNNNLLILYNQTVSTNCTLAKISLENDMEIIDSILFNAKNIQPGAGFCINGDNLTVIYKQYNDSSGAHIKNINLIDYTMSNQLLIGKSASSYHDIIYYKEQNGIKYFLVIALFNNNRTPFVYSISFSNNVLAQIDSYNSWDDSMNGAFRIFNTGNDNIVFTQSGSSRKFMVNHVVVYSDFQVEIDNRPTFTNYQYCEVECFGNKLLVAHNNVSDGKLKVAELTVSGKNVTETNIINLEEKGEYDSSHICGKIGNYFYVIYKKINLDPLELVLIRVSDLAIVDRIKLDMINFNNTGNIATGNYKGQIFIAVQEIINNTSNNASNVYLLKIENDRIVQTIKPAEKKINGITKSTCTSEQAGEVWVLN